MCTVKTRKVGNSLAITFPKELNVEEGKEFIIYKGVDDVIVLAPKIPIPFDSIEPNIIECHFDNMVLLDNEE
ncbi:TPA: AbrB/MazE/SpoVT family DNA-binding domain-containing protein [Streptococcus suis]|nr:AbrB/MazE/SpoVT family DNA-binding domain-containing protein [Streptococcus suis]QCO71502.1 Programmed cell death antitoxin MazE [Streptococcus suis]